MTRFQKAAAPWVTRALAARGEAWQDTILALRSSRLSVAPETYLLLSILVPGAALLVVAAVAGVLAHVLMPGQPLLMGLAAALLGGASGMLARLVFRAYPRAVASSRGRRIELEFPSVVTLCYALSRGSIPILQVFRAVAEETDAYPESSKEFQAVLADFELMGVDLHTAMMTVAASTPSETLRRFFEGLVAILNSGADTQEYFKHQADTQLQQAELVTERVLDSAAMLAEVYVNALLVLPLLLVVILSVFSAFGGAGDSEAIIPLILYAMVPLGTVGFFVLVDMVLPPDPVVVPRPQGDVIDDFGFDVARQGHLETRPAWMRLGELKPRPDETRFQLFVRRLQDRVSRRVAAIAEASIESPSNVLVVSVPLGLLVGVGGFLALWAAGASAYALTVGLSHCLLAAAIVAAAPVAVLHEVRVRRLRVYEGELPELLSKLSSFNDRGVGLLRAFEIVGETASGSLVRELRQTTREVAWTGNFRGALRRLRARISTPEVSKVMMLFERASRATGSLKKVIDVAAHDATRMQKLRTRKRQSMLSYVIVVYVVFGVFLYTVYMVADLFYGEAGFTTVAAGAAGAGGLGGGTDPEVARVRFFHGSIIQGICSGLVAGVLGESSLLSGLKHGIVLASLAWLVFALGVL